jgi:hypothetical protein
MTKRSGATETRRHEVMALCVSVTLWLVVVCAAPVYAQRAAAPVDLTGQWVALVTNEWQWRMLTPPKGVYDVIPLTAEARKVADTWDPAKDEAAGLQCRSYGAAAIMQVPARFRISWADDTTLRMETDNGQQTRLFRFGRPEPPTGEPTWQGHSVAQWLPARGQAREVNVEPRAARTGTLRVVTTRLRPGYLRKNGVPYSGETTVTESFTPFTDARGSQYFNVTVVVEDPRYLNDAYVRSMQFRKEPDGAKWSPQPCTSR